MGCGASSGKGGAEASPTQAKTGSSGQPPLASKAPSGKKLSVYEKSASLGRRSINDSFRVSSDRRSLKQTSDSLPPIDEGNGIASNGSGSRRSKAGSKSGIPPESPKSSVTALPPVPGASPPQPKPPPTPPSQPQQPQQDTSAWRPALQVPRMTSAPLACVAPPSGQQQPPSREGSASGGSPGAMPDGTLIHIQHLSSGGGSAAGQVAAAAHIRQVLCRTRAPVQALLDAGVAAALVRCLKEGPQEAKLEAAWALANIAASSDYSQVEALCNAEAPQALVALLRPSSRGAPGRAPSGGRPPSGSGGGSGGGSSSSALQEQALWALANMAGAIHPELKTQALAVDVLDAGALAPACGILEAEAEAAARAAEAPPADGGHAASGAASSRSLGGAAAAAAAAGAMTATPLLRCAAWCVHNLAKHKREKDMVNVIPVATRLLLESEDPEVLACCAWVLAYLGTNEDNKSHLKQALPALPRLVPWVREAATPLATPALLCMGTLCTGYMKALDYSGDVVDAGGVPAMLSFLKRANSLGGPRGRDMVKEALFALSNVAGGNNATVAAMLDAGVFTDVLALLRSLGEDEELRLECLYVLTNPWDPLVGTEVPVVKKLMECGILHELHELLDPQAPAPRLGLLLKGLADGLKRGQQLMTYAANLQLVELGREAAASAPPPSNPVRDLYVELGTVGRIEALNGHPDEEVATRANGILTVLKFM